MVGLPRIVGRAPDWLLDWHGDGVITRSASPEVIDLLRRKKLPAINLTDVRDNRELPRVWVDHAATGRTAAQHLLERGFRNFGYCGFGNHDWSRRREAGFRAALPGDYSFSAFNSDWGGALEPSWDQRQTALEKWLATLPKPAGIMACNDMRGQHLLDACRRAELSVPEEIAVIGVDNDELLCGLCDPPLSSVDVNPRRVGFEAARMLDALMDGEKLPSEELLIEPLGAISRLSTDVLAIDNPEIATALRTIRRQACDGLSVAELMRQTKLSRGALERLFRKYLRRSPQQVIRTTRLKRVKELLTATGLPLAEIAEMTGFRHNEYLSVVFKREFGETPGDYRRRAKPQRETDSPPRKAKK
ncbi:MAG: DNA-binding transcriptional regulator [Pirellulales bacterium]